MYNKPACTLTKCAFVTHTERLSINLIMSGMCLMMKGLREVMYGSLALNSTRLARLARFCTPLATSFRVREEDSEGLPERREEQEEEEALWNDKED